VVTYKKDVDSAEAKVREEKEVAVADFAAMKEIFQSMGLSPWLEMKKHRTTFEIGAVHFEFDKYHGNYEYIPEFIEIEGPDTETVYRYAEKLGFGRKDCRPWDALEVAEHYSSRRNG
jgi:adenylate cyclase class IV